MVKYLNPVTFRFDRNIHKDFTAVKPKEDEPAKLELVEDYEAVEGENGEVFVAALNDDEKAGKAPKPRAAAD